MPSLCFLTLLLIGMLSVPGPAPSTRDSAWQQSTQNNQLTPALPYRMVATAPTPQPSGKARVVPAPQATRPTPEPPPLQHSPAPTPGQKGTTTVYVYNVYQYPPPSPQPAVDPDVEDAYYNPVFPASENTYLARPQYIARGQLYYADITYPYPNPPNYYMYRYLAAIGERDAQIGSYPLSMYVPVQTPWLRSHSRPSARRR